MWVILTVSRSTGAMKVYGQFPTEGRAVAQRDRWIAGYRGEDHTYHVLAVTPPGRNGRVGPDVIDEAESARRRDRRFGP